MVASAAGRNISLTERQSRFLDEQVASGRHASASEVVREALRRYEEDVAHESASLAALHAVAARGDADYAAGRVHAYDTPEAHAASMNRLLDEAKAQVKARRARG